MSKLGAHEEGTGEFDSDEAVQIYEFTGFLVRWAIEIETLVPTVSRYNEHMAQPSLYR